jgi:hypothetical protein
MTIEQSQYSLKLASLRLACMQSVTVRIACSAAGNVSEYRACMAAKQRTTMHYVHIPDFIAHHGSSTGGSGMAVVSDGEKQQ